LTISLNSRAKLGLNYAHPRHFRELSEIRACARDLPSPADPERGVAGANRPNLANPLYARFPCVRLHAIGGMPIGGSERSGAGLSLFFRPQRVAESASHLAASERCVLRTAGTPKSRPEKENRDDASKLNRLRENRSPARRQLPQEKDRGSQAEGRTCLEDQDGRRSATAVIASEAEGREVDLPVLWQRRPRTGRSARGGTRWPPLVF